MADPNRLETVIVAIPQQDDYVWKVSSEKIPHMTLLYLGEMQPTDQMVGFVEHAASLQEPFGMGVDRRGTLGPQDADVLFFDKGYTAKRLNDFRGQLMANQEIYKAYHSTVQYPEWTPHLTLGYPETPAKPMNRDYGFNWVEFDRIAIWTGDSEGPTFQLQHSFSRLELAMSTIPQGSSLEEVLEHYGVKGMKWGVRKRSRQTDPTSADAVRVGSVKTRVKTQKTTRILSNQELEDAIKRMRLEQDFSKLSGGIDKTRGQKAKQFISKLLIDTGKQNVSQVAQSESKKFIDEALKKKAA